LLELVLVWPPVEGLLNPYLIWFVLVSSTRSFLGVIELEAGCVRVSETLPVSSSISSSSILRFPFYANSSIILSGNGMDYPEFLKN